MNHYHCDICDAPIKNNNQYTLYVSTPEDTETYHKNYTKMYENVLNNKKDICAGCKQLIDKIFEYRKQDVKKMLKDLQKTYDLPVKKIKRKNK